ncbi:hypothetical protein RND71_033300 [Anisodus tanguticus]|uniref:Uncharacterized protein n=1 Tax=Anisodus tanguticus TaxID=243964 RepID=A0AAE1V1B4_9SOLA|nr:hypothetical protein RND71_033300 [Anisodus tanguticus]
MLSTLDTVVTPRKTSRVIRPRIWHNDYVITKKSNAACLYPIKQTVYYSELFVPCQTYLSVISSITEPTSFKEASKDQHWIDATQAEVDALEQNKTWEIVTLPPRRRPYDLNGCTK